MNLTSDAILYYADNPVDFVEDIIRAKPDSNQRAILNSVAQYPMTSVRSGHGIGKSAVESWLAIWFLTTRPYPKIPCSRSPHGERGLKSVSRRRPVKRATPPMSR